MSSFMFADRARAAIRVVDGHVSVRPAATAAGEITKGAEA